MAKGMTKGSPAITAKGMAFRLFDKGRRPSDISLWLVCDIKRHTLNRYYQEWVKLRHLSPALALPSKKARRQRRPGRVPTQEEEKWGWR